MPTLILLNKPYGVVCQFSDHAQHATLKPYVEAPGFYPAGRLDADSEGLLVLTNDGALQHRLSAPRWKLPKTYWVQVEGVASGEQLAALRAGVALADGMTDPAEVVAIAPPSLWPRDPPIRYRQRIKDSWLAITLCQGRNRQVRRMTAHVGLPTLRLVRVALGPWCLGTLQPGEARTLTVTWHEVTRHLAHGGQQRRLPRHR